MSSVSRPPPSLLNVGWVVPDVGPSHPLAGPERKTAGEGEATLHASGPPSVGQFPASFAVTLRHRSSSDACGDQRRLERPEEWGTVAGVDNAHAVTAVERSGAGAERSQTRTSQNRSTPTALRKRGFGSGLRALGPNDIDPAMSCVLGCLVNARRSLYQSKPSIEASKPNTAQGGCKANTPAARSGRSVARATETRRQSRQPEPTQVSGLIATQLRAWSCETAAKPQYVKLDETPTSDDQQRRCRIRAVVRRRSRIPRKTTHSPASTAQARAE
jgi:hypothetical protein